MVLKGHIGICTRAASASFFTLLVLASAAALSCGKKAKGPAEASSAPSERNVYASSSGGLFLREAADASSAKIAYIPYGERLTLPGETGPEESIGGITAHWLKARFYDAEGWVFAAHVSPEEPPMASIAGKALSSSGGYYKIGALNLDTRWFAM